MLAKLVFRNVKRNLQTYSIYFATLTIIYSLLYSFNTVVSNPVLNEAGDTKQILSRFMEQFMGVLSIFAAIAFIFLVLYSTQFVLKRRSKELGLYSSLGMKNKKIGKILFFESIIVNSGSLILGFIIGWIISLFLTKILISIFALSSKVNYFYVSSKAIFITVICFFIIVIISSIFNKIKINRVSIISLLKEEDANGNEIKLNRISQIIGMSISIICLSVSAYLINSLQDISSLKSLGYIILIVSVIGILIFYYTFGNMLIRLIKRIPKLYYKSSNTVLFRELSTESNKNSVTIAVMSIFLTLSFSIVLIGGSSYISMNKEISNSSPYNLTIIANKPLNKGQFLKELNDRGIDTKALFSNSVDFYTYKSTIKYKDLGIEDKNLWQIDNGLENQSVSVINISEFNKILEMQGEEKINLDKNQYIINCNYKGTLSYINNFLEQGRSLNIGNSELQPKFQSPTDNTIIMTSVGNNDRGTLIVHDSITDSLEKDHNVLNAIYKKGVDERKLTRMINEYIMDHSWTNDSGLQFDYKYQTRDRLRDIFSGSMGAIVFLTMFTGVIFTLISLCILSIQITTTAISFKKDSKILNSLGLKYDKISKLLLKEILIYFSIPCILAIPGGILVGKKIISFFETFLNFTIQVNPVVLIIQIALFSFYIFMTYSNSKKIIKD